ncbi:MAG: hypothetical protein WDW38_002641 [Sanguina aurantia]
MGTKGRSGSAVAASRKAASSQTLLRDLNPTASDVTINSTSLQALMMNHPDLEDVQEDMVQEYRLAARQYIEKLLLPPGSPSTMPQPSSMQASALQASAEDPFATHLSLEALTQLPLSELQRLCEECQLPMHDTAEDLALELHEMMAEQQRSSDALQGQELLESTADAEAMLQAELAVGELFDDDLQQRLDAAAAAAAARTSDALPSTTSSHKTITSTSTSRDTHHQTPLSAAPATDHSTTPNPASPHASSVPNLILTPNPTTGSSSGSNSSSSSGGGGSLFTQASTAKPTLLASDPYAPAPDTAQARETLRRRLYKLLLGRGYTNKDPSLASSLRLLKPPQLLEVCEDLGLAVEEGTAHDDVAAMVAEVAESMVDGAAPLIHLGSHSVVARDFKTAVAGGAQAPLHASPVSANGRAAAAGDSRSPGSAEGGVTGASLSLSLSGAETSSSGAETRAGFEGVDNGSSRSGGGLQGGGSGRGGVSSAAGGSSSSGGSSGSGGSSSAGNGGGGGGFQVYRPSTPAAMSLRREEVKAANRRRAELLQELLQPDEVAKWLVAARAQDVVVVDLRGKGGSVDHMVVGTGMSTKHTQACAEAVRYQIKDKLTALALGGLHGDIVPEAPPRSRISSSDWAAVEAGRLAVHVLTEQARGYYRLEELWKAEPRDLTFYDNAEQYLTLENIRVPEEAKP